MLGINFVLSGSHLRLALNYATKDDLEFMIILTLAPECWIYRHTSQVVYILYYLYDNSNF